MSKKTHPRILGVAMEDIVAGDLCFLEIDPHTGSGRIYANIPDDDMSDTPTRNMSSRFEGERN